ncbi:MAG TPA: hypothetical protein VD887_09590 [Allosphingosinicella sp.]|nr:hypothetical protein [Allosphingosinicella sp.]
MATGLAFALIVRWPVGERGQPFLVAGLFIAAQMVAMGQLGDLAIVRSALTFLATCRPRRCSPRASRPARSPAGPAGMPASAPRCGSLRRRSRPDRGQRPDRGLTGDSYQ